MTKVQKVTIFMLVLYAIWEIYVQIWSKTETTAVIRVDLFLIYPILIILIFISVIQYLRK